VGLLNYLRMLEVISLESIARSLKWLYSSNLYWTSVKRRRKGLRENSLYDARDCSIERLIIRALEESGEQRLLIEDCIHSNWTYYPRSLSVVDRLPQFFPQFFIRSFIREIQLFIVQLNQLLDQPQSLRHTSTSLTPATSIHISSWSSRNPSDPLT